MANVQLQDVQKIPYAVLETDADGNAVVPAAGDSVSVVSADTDSFTVVPDTTVDPAKAPAGSTPLQTGFIVGGKKNQAGVSITATITKGDSTATPIPPIVILLDNVTGPASNGSISLGQPEAQ